MLVLRSLTILLIMCAGIACAEEPTTPPPESLSGAPALWVPGHWVWTGSHWSWSAGAWQTILEPVRARWIAGHWAGSAAGWVWIPGHYENATEDTTGAAAAPASAPPPTGANPASPTAEAVVVERPYTTVVVEQPYCPPAGPVGIAISGPPVIMRAPLLPPSPRMLSHIASVHHGFGWFPLALLDPLLLLRRH
jgi:hypothetical protein